MTNQNGYAHVGWVTLEKLPCVYLKYSERQNAGLAQALAEAQDSFRYVFVVLPNMSTALGEFRASVDNFYRFDSQLVAPIPMNRFEVEIKDNNHRLLMYSSDSVSLQVRDVAGKLLPMQSGSFSRREVQKKVFRLVADGEIYLPAGSANNRPSTDMQMAPGEILRLKL
jgi:hypothetical protein